MNQYKSLPPPLVPGDTVAIIAPAGGLVDTDRLRQGCALITDMGFNLYDRCLKWPVQGHLADSDQARVDELHRTWTNPEIAGIIALRGGFGSARLLDRIDFNLIRQHPKLLVGFSDITILLNQLFLKTGIISMHGPVLTTLSLGDRNTLDRFYQCLTGNWSRNLCERVEIIRGGLPVSGTLLGGNLTSIVSLLGTPWSLKMNGSIVFFEDVNEPIYRLDRLLTQLAQAGQLCQAAGIILGDFSMTDESLATSRISRKEWVWERLLELTENTTIPIWGDFPVGHACRNLTMPIGAHVVMDSSRRELRFEEPRHHWQQGN